jgi:hypothetical protein
MFNAVVLWDDNVKMDLIKITWIQPVHDGIQWTLFSVKDQEFWGQFNDDLFPYNMNQQDALFSINLFQ